MSYAIASSYLVIRDAPREEFYDLSFHVASGDYFRMLATALGFVEEELRDASSAGSDRVRLLRKIREDLQRLHETHVIVAKDR